MESYVDVYSDPRLWVACDNALGELGIVAPKLKVQVIVLSTISAACSLF